MTALLERKVLADKALRDTTKQAFDSNMALVKIDLEARGIAGRVADEIAGRAKVVYEEAAEVAQEHPGVLGGTIAALVLWILRNPIIAWLEEILGPRR